MTSASTPPSSGGSTSSDAVAGLEGRVESWLYSVVYICNCLFNIYLSPRHDVRGSRVMTCGSRRSRVTCHTHMTYACTCTTASLPVLLCMSCAFHSAQMARSITIHFVTFVYSYSELTSLTQHAVIPWFFGAPRLRPRVSLITLLTYLLTLDGNGYGAPHCRAGGSTEAAAQSKR